MLAACRPNQTTFSTTSSMESSRLLMQRRLVNGRDGWYRREGSRSSLPRTSPMWPDAGVPQLHARQAPRHARSCITCPFPIAAVIALQPYYAGAGPTTAVALPLRLDSCTLDDAAKKLARGWQLAMGVLLPSCDTRDTTGCHWSEWPAQATLVRQYRCSASPLFRQGSPWEHCKLQRTIDAARPPADQCVCVASVAAAAAVSSGGGQWAVGSSGPVETALKRELEQTTTAANRIWRFRVCGVAVLQEAGTPPRPCLSDENLSVSGGDPSGRNPSSPIITEPPAAPMNQFCLPAPL